MARGDEGDRRLGRLAPVCSPDRGHLEMVAADEVEVEDVREAEEIVGGHLPRLDWTRVSLRECYVRLADVAELVADRARLIDSHLSEPDITDLRSTDSTWRSVTVEGGRIGAWDLSGGVVDGLTMAGAQLGYVNLRDATLTDVAVRDCRIETLDLAGAKARRVSLSACVIGELVVTRADLDELDLRGAQIERVDGVEDLGGAIISADQLLDLAPALAKMARITIGPWPGLGIDLDTEDVRDSQGRRITETRAADSGTAQVRRAQGRVEPGDLRLAADQLVRASPGPRGIRVDDGVHPTNAELHTGV